MLNIKMASSKTRYECFSYENRRIARNKLFKENEKIR